MTFCCQRSTLTDGRDSMNSLNIKLTPEAAHQLRELCRATKRTKSSLVREAIEELHKAMKEKLS